MAESELVLISHGNLSVEMKKSCELIMGPQEHIHTVSLLPAEGQDDFLKKFNEVVADIPAEELIVFADLMGGTPANTIAKQIMSGRNIHMIAGMNLAMVIEWVNSKMIGNASDYITTAKAGIVDVNQALAGMMKK